MAGIEEQISAKKKELESLKKIAQLTDTMKSQLIQLGAEVKEMEKDGSNVANVMSVWDSVTQSISAAGLGLLRYGEDNYKVGEWKEPTEDKATDAAEKPAIPLPEGLVRVSTTNEES